MNIQLPDKFYKFLVFISFILIVFVYMKTTENSNREINSINYRNSLIDSLELNKIKEKQIKDNLIDYAEILSLRNNIKNPITSSNDSIIAFHRTISSNNKKEIEINDLVNEEWKRFENQQNKILILVKRIDQANEENKIANKLFEDEFFWLIVTFSLISGALLYEGIKSWYKQETSLNRVLIDKNLLVHERCQSCYKKFSTIRNYSKNEDESINYAFCDECCRDGHFTEKYRTIEDLYHEIDNTNLKAHEISNLKHNIKMLDRWKSNEY